MDDVMGLRVGFSQTRELQTKCSLCRNSSVEDETCPSGVPATFRLKVFSKDDR